MSKRIKIIDYIKAVCILMVIVMHCEVHDYIDKIALMPFYVDLAVPCFFMLSGYTLSARMKKRMGNDTRFINQIRNGYALKNDLKSIIVPYTIAFILVVLMKLFTTDTSYSIYNLIYMYLTGSAGTGGYFVIVYIQILLIFPVLFSLVSCKKKTGVFIAVLINVLFEVIVQILVSSGMDILNFYRLCGVRYLSAVVLGIYIFKYSKNIKNLLLFIMFLMGSMYIFSYAYLGVHPIGVTYWPHSSFYTSLFICPVIVWLLRREKNSENKIEKLLSIIGQNSFFIFCVQMDFFTSKYSWHLGNLSPVKMCILSLLICTSIGVFYGSVCRIILKKM